MLNMKGKKLFSVLLAFVLTITVSGCGMYAKNEEVFLDENYVGNNVRNNDVVDDDGNEGYPVEYEMLEDYDGGDDGLWRNAEFESNEQYGMYEESPFKDAVTSPLSTFSASPNTASYSNMRRFINNGVAPYANSVRIEELVNYFKYDYLAPKVISEHPFTINTEVAPCPWNSDNLLAMIGIQGESLAGKERLPSNVVFLIDVSGSMAGADRIELAKTGFIEMVNHFNENDVVSIVTYAGNSRIEADSIRGHNKNEIKSIINGLTAGGSTAGSKGITDAYALAEKNFIEGGNNRIILATDGDFNVGVSSTDGLVKLVEEQRDKGIFISVLGFGMSNLNDYMMESIAKHGNGNYAYIDTLEEAKKVLIEEFDSTMYVIAKDLKLQIEFNPAVVKQYRLIGYDNRRLNNEDFNDDEKDAGDIGADFAVTAFYEIVPAAQNADNNSSVSQSVDVLTYQTTEFTGSSDFMNVKVRYKRPEGGSSKLVEKIVGEAEYTQRPTDRFKFASAVAEFGLIISESKYKAQASVSDVIIRARGSVKNDSLEFKAEFVSLVEKYAKNID